MAEFELCPRSAARFSFLCAISLACTPPFFTSVSGQSSQPQSASERVITAQEFGRVVTVSLGQTFVIRRPLDEETWQVDFATDILDLLNSTETRQSPGPTGWRFRAIGAGETDVAVTERPAPGRGNPPAPRRFVVTIRVTK